VCDVIVFPYQIESEYRGSAEMCLDGRHVSFTPKERRWYFAMAKGLSVAYEDVRELKDQVTKKKRFTMAFHPESDAAPNRLKVTIKEDDPEKLACVAEMFDALPDTARALRCPFCGGPVIDKVCRQCERPYRRVHVRHAFRFFLVAIGMIVVGLLLLNYCDDHGIGESFTLKRVCLCT